MQDYPLNTQSVNNFWINRQSFSSIAPEGPLTDALFDDQLTRREYDELKDLYFDTHPNGDFDEFLADALDGKQDDRISHPLLQKVQKLGQVGSAVAALNLEINVHQDAYSAVYAVSEYPKAPAPAATVTSIEFKPATKEQMQAAIKQAVDDSFQRVPNVAGQTRHELNRRLQSLNSTPQGSVATSSLVPAHYDGSEIVVIAFEGTGSFQPRRAPVMQAAAEQLHQQGLKPDDSLYDIASSQLEQREPEIANWSGLGAGPLSALLSDPELNRKTQWLSFPSEEVEALAHPNAYKSSSVGDAIGQLIDSYDGNPRGINAAIQALRDIQRQAAQQGKNPQFVVVSHSSGGRSVVKFLEKAKDLHDASGTQLKFPFVMTIDPVREAHEAVGEAIKEIYINKGTEHNINRVRAVLDYLPLIDLPPKKVYPPTVRSQSQPESLYKPGNVGQFTSFYQRQDTLGLKMDDFKFGIHGSPVAGAINIEVKNVGDAGHGEITYQPQVLNAFMQGIKNQIPK